MAFEHSDLIEVKRVKGKGRGVFARRAIPEGAVIERVPVLVLPMDDVKDTSAWTGLAGYCFLWGDGTVALALGYGSLYNHSYRPNARYDDVPRQSKIFRALRDIAAGEEITVNYNGDPADRSPLDFEVIEDAAPEPPVRVRPVVTSNGSVHVRRVVDRSPRTPKVD
jgi:SET domain-containing protein